MTDMVSLTAPSFTTLLVRAIAPNLADDYAAPLVLSSAATAIIIQRNHRRVLVTAGHVVTGQHAQTGQPIKHGGTPQYLAVRIPHESLWRAYVWIHLPLRSAEGAPLWREHPQGREVDVVAVPIPERVAFCDEHGVALHDSWATFESATAIRPELDWFIEHPLAPISLDVPDELSVVGFPFGITGGHGLAIWTRGNIATEMQFDHDGLPMFLLDARTRPGHSGAPVVFFSRSGLFPTGDGVAMGLGDHLLRFMGIYSGRAHEDSDLGRVFRTDAVLTTIDAGAPPAPDDAV